MNKKIGVIGSGIVGQTLANGFIKHGYEVMLGTNTPAKREELQTKTNGKAAIGTFEETARFGDLLVLAVKSNAVDKALLAAGITNFKGKTVIDTNNPIADLPPVNGVLQYYTNINESLMERLQKLAPEANFVKAFSCIGSSGMVNADFHGVKPTMFICGNSTTAKTEVTTILDQFGFETEDMGPVEAARAIEPLAMLWCIPGFTKNQWTHAFKLIKR